MTITKYYEGPSLWAGNHKIRDMSKFIYSRLSKFEVHRHTSALLLAHATFDTMLIVRRVFPVYIVSQTLLLNMPINHSAQDALVLDEAKYSYFKT